jgi:hypothetical protein
MEPKRSPQEDDERIKKLMADIGYPDSRSVYQAFKQIIMETRLQYEDAWKKPVPPSISAAADRFERACMAYERLGNMKKDDEKTRQIRKDAIAEYGESRRNLLYAMRSPISKEDFVLEERKRCARIAKYHTHHALWAGLPIVSLNEAESFGIALAQRIEQAIRE